MAKRDLWEKANKVLSEKFIFVLIGIYPLLFIWQGMDFTDTGFSLTNFQQIFNEPSSIESSYRLWLTNVLGGIWLYIFGDSLGLFGYRLAGVLLVYGTLYLSFLTLKPYIDKTHLSWGLLLALMFINRSGYQFNYNSLTAIFYVLAAYLLIKGFEKDKKYLIFFAALTLGLNIFIRLPNILGFLLISCIFIEGYLNKTSISVQVKRLTYFLGGYLFSILIILSVMYLAGQLEAYIYALKGTSLMLNDHTGHHAGSKLIKVIADLYRIILIKAGDITVFLTGMLVLLTISSMMQKKFLQHIVIIIFTFVCAYIYRDFYKNWYAMIGTVSALSYIVGVLYLFNLGKQKTQLRLIAFLAILILIIVPLGSANGFVNAVFGMYLSIPLVVNYIYEQKELKINIKQFTRQKINDFYLRLTSDEMRLIKVITILVFMAFVLKSTYHYTYRDSVSRLQMVHTVDHSRLIGVFTTRERALVVQELVNVLPQYVQEGDYLLAYEQVSLVYFLTKTKPYLYGSWPMLFSPEKFEKCLHKAVEERPNLPVIVRAKGNTEEFTWPKTRGLRKDYYLSSSRKIMHDFINEKNYQTAWENSFFEILVPGRTERGGR